MKRFFATAMAACCLIASRDVAAQPKPPVFEPLSGQFAMIGALDTECVKGVPQNSVASFIDISKKKSVSFGVMFMWNKETPREKPAGYWTATGEDPLSGNDSNRFADTYDLMKPRAIEFCKQHPNARGRLLRPSLDQA